MGDGELARVVEESAVLHRIIEGLLIGKLEHIGACAHTLETVLGVVIFELQTSEDAVYPHAAGKFIGKDGCRDVTEIAIRKDLCSESCIDVVLAVAVDVIYDKVD